MKQSKLSVLTLLLFISGFLFNSCSNDDEGNPLSPNETVIAIEGEGDNINVPLGGGDWKIAGVINKDGNVRIHGEILSPDGELIRENVQLELEGLGQLYSVWNDKGFHIIREDPASIKIIIEPNSTGEDFNFAIILENAEKRKTITIKQKKSQGYSFDNIEYSIKEGDGDSLYIRKGTSYRFNIHTPQEVTVSPVIDIEKYSYFSSEDKNAFVWLIEEPVIVETPSGFYDNTIFFNGGKRPYNSNTITSPYESDNNKYTIFAPAGKSEFIVETQLHKRKISYTLTLTNNRTKEKKSVEGKWIEIAPTGEFSIKQVE